MVKHYVRSWKRDSHGRVGRVGRMGRVGRVSDARLGRNGKENETRWRLD